MKGHALLIIDMINALDYPAGPRLLRTALPAARRIAQLKRRLKTGGVPVIYVNDNYGQWRSDFRQVVAMCSAPGSVGAPLVAELPPQPDDYFVLKPEQSGFRDTPLQRLLDSLDVSHLVITGIALDACVLATAVDANMHGYRTFVPSDCVASESDALKQASLKVLKASPNADVRQSRWIGARAAPRGRS